MTIPDDPDRPKATAQAESAASAPKREYKVGYGNNIDLLRSHILKQLLNGRSLQRSS
jgi:hypothetical protein